MKRYLEALLAGQRFNRLEAGEILRTALDFETRPEQVAAFFFALHIRGETVAELGGFLDVLRAEALVMTGGAVVEPVVDNCGTGGDNAGTFNLSTGAALIAAAAGAYVAKHGNRALSSRSGSADVLEALGIPTCLGPREASSALIHHGFAFLFAPIYHPALSRLAPIRKALGVRTALNAVGPLASPARVKRQVVGVYRPALLEPFAELLREAGHEEAMILHSDDGMDEISIASATRILHLKNGRITSLRVEPETFGLPRGESHSLAGGDATENARLLLAIFHNEDRGPRLSALLANASALLVVAGKARTFREGAELAREAVESGAALRLITDLRAREEVA